MPDGHHAVIPITWWLPHYDRRFPGEDVLAAVAVWAVLVPQIA